MWSFALLLGWPPGTRRDLGCYLYHSEKILTHPNPPGLTELSIRYMGMDARVSVRHNSEFKSAGATGSHQSVDRLVTGADNAFAIKHWRPKENRRFGGSRAVVACLTNISKKVLSAY